MSDLNALPMNELVAKHNELVHQLADLGAELRKDAGPKTFSTRAKAVVRILALQSELDLLKEVSDVEEEVSDVEEEVSDVEEEVSDAEEGISDAEEGISDVEEAVAASESETVFEPKTTECQEEPAAQATEQTTVAADEQKPAVVPTNKNGQPHIIRTLSEELLLRVEPALSYEDVLAKVKEAFPKSSTTIACLRWYAVQLRERGEKVPNRPRAPRKQPTKKEG